VEQMEQWLNRELNRQMNSQFKWGEGYWQHVETVDTNQKWSKLIQALNQLIREDTAGGGQRRGS